MLMVRNAFLHGVSGRRAETLSTLDTRGDLIEVSVCISEQLIQFISLSPIHPFNKILRALMHVVCMKPETGEKADV